MRVTSVFCAVLLWMASTTAAQTTSVGPWQPRPSIGVGVGRLSASETSATWKGLISGTLEIPITDNGRFRVEAGRSSFPMPYAANNSLWGRTARLSRITVGGAGLIRPGAPVSPYVGFSFGAYRLSLDGTGGVMTSGGHLYGGAEIMGSDHLSINAELGLHLIDRNPFNEKLFAEATLRIKVGL